MYKKTLLSSAVATALLASLISQSVLAATDTGTASAQIVTPIAITNTTDLFFGSIVADPAGDTISLDTANNATITNTSVITGISTSGSFDVTGTTGAVYTVTLPGPTLISSGGNNMTVNNFSHDGGATPTIAAGGSTLNIGADLTIAAGQAQGVYTGTYTVTVEYQ